MDRIKVLVVDDESDFIDLFVKRFQMRNLEVAAVGGGPQALEYLRDHEMDVVVLDVRMPGMDGMETLREIKKRHPEVEVIMLTGHGSVQSGIEGMNNGAYDYVMKPFKIDDLLERIRRAHEHGRLNREGRA